MQLKGSISNYFYSLVKKGTFGRERQMQYFLSQEKNTAFNIKETESRKLYKKIRKKYTEIRLHRLYSSRIGEYIPRYCIAVEDAAINAKKGILDVFVLDDCINHNYRLSKIIGRNIQIIDETNVDIWKYILCKFPNVEFDKYWDYYMDRSRVNVFKPENTAKYFMFTEDEEKESQYKKSLMGLDKPFVCISSRDSLYLETILPNVNCHYHDYRDSDINKLNLAAEYLSEKGITMVRMGRYVKDKVDFINCIDYANKYYDELMDIALIKDCKFFLGDSNGICILPMALNKPVALKNVVPAFSDGFGGHPQNPQNLFIFKKYYKRNENRFLSIKEMMLAWKKAGFYGDRYEKMGIEIVENSAEEILDLAMEMNARIEGKWIETTEDIELQKKYKSILMEWIKKENLKEGTVFYGKIGAMFLRKNPFLLED